MDMDLHLAQEPSLLSSPFILGLLDEAGFSQEA
jgi:hypothetical protein